MNAISAVTVSIPVYSFGAFDSADAAVREVRDVPTQSKHNPVRHHADLPEVFPDGGDKRLHDLERVPTSASRLVAQSFLL